MSISGKFGYLFAILLPITTFVSYIKMIFLNLQNNL